MSDPDSVKRVLADLAVEPRFDDDRAVIERAATAVLDIERAASFVGTTGVTRLETALAAADSRGKRNLVRRGQRALAVIQRFRDAA